MNTKSKHTRLIVEFKEFQRLPDWAIIKLIDPNRTSENPDEQKIALSQPCRAAASPAHTFAE